MKTRTALAALTLSALALPLRRHRARRGRATEEADDVRTHGALRRPGASGSSRPSPTTAGSSSRPRSTATAPARSGTGRIKHNGSVSAKGSSTTHGASGSFTVERRMANLAGNGPLHVPCRASRHGRGLPWHHLLLSVDAGPPRPAAGEGARGEGAAQPGAAVRGRQPAAVRASPGGRPGGCRRRAARHEALADARVTTELLAHSVAEPAIPEGLVDGDAGRDRPLRPRVLDRLLVRRRTPDQDLARRRHRSSTATRPS